jgi:hypothetical protein
MVCPFKFTVGFMVALIKKLPLLATTEEYALFGVAYSGPYLFTRA